MDAAGCEACGDTGKVLQCLGCYSTFRVVADHTNCWGQPCTGHGTPPVDCRRCKFVISVGTVSSYVVRERPWFWKSFGCAEYSRDRPVLSEGRRSRAQPIVDMMNRGEVTPEEGMRLLDEKAFF